MATVFRDSFERGDTSAWDGTNGTPTITHAAALVGSWGMEANAAGDAVQDSFVATSRYRARFWLDPNGLTMNNGNWIRTFRVEDGGSDCGLIQLGFQAGYIIQAKILHDDATWGITGSYAIADAPCCIEADWLFQNNTGFCSLWIDESLQETLANQDGGTIQPDSCELCWRSATGSPSGTIYLDHFCSNNDGDTIGCGIRQPRNPVYVYQVPAVV